MRLLIPILLFSLTMLFGCASQEVIPEPVFPSSSSVKKIVSRNAHHESLYTVPLSDASLIADLYDALGQAKGKWNYRKPKYSDGLRKLTFYGEDEKEICNLIIGTDFIRSNCGINRTDISLPTLYLMGELYGKFQHLNTDIDRYERNSWERTLVGLDKAVQDRITELCNLKAHQTVYDTVDNVMSVFLGPGTDGMPTHFAGNLSGVGRGPMVYSFLRLGLTSIEHPASRKKTGSVETQEEVVPQFEVFDTKTRTHTPTKSLKSFVEITIAPATTLDDQANHIHGRTVAVRNMRTGKILAERTEFYWYDKTGRYRHERALCPSITRWEYTPLSFIGKVINPATYTCMNKYVADQQLLNSHHPDTNRKLFEQLTECEKAYFANIGIAQ